MPIVDVYGHLSQRVIDIARKHVKQIGRCFRDPQYQGDDKKDWANHFGGYFCLMDNKTGLILLATYIGDPAQFKMPKYARLAPEKVFRVFNNPQIRTSWDNRDDAKEWYPGAVRGIRYIYGFSGYPPHGDTLVSACVAEEIEHLTLDLDARLEPEMWISPGDNQARDAAVVYARYLQAVEAGV